MPRSKKLVIIDSPVAPPESEESETENENMPNEGNDEEGPRTVKDLRLPETTVIKMMKEVIPKNAIISQEAKDCMRRLPTMFVLFITDYALQVARKNKRRTILPEDIVEALEENDFYSFAEKVVPLVERRKANYRRKPKDAMTDQLEGRDNPADSAESHDQPTTDCIPNQPSASEQQNEDSNHNESAEASSHSSRSPSASSDNSASPEAVQDEDLTV